MSEKSSALLASVTSRFAGKVSNARDEFNEVTVDVARKDMLEVLKALRDEPAFAFAELIDVCGIDYAAFGCAEWAAEEATGTGFSRGYERDPSVAFKLSDGQWDKPRFAAIYHLLSIDKNQRIRVRVFAEGEPPMVDTVVDLWSCANWFEREAFDLYGILFVGHPDLRRILTDYGFIGHPFRKDFPLSGNVEMRYDPEKQRVIYEPVSITPRVLVPRVIREAETPSSAKE